MRNRLLILLVLCFATIGFAQHAAGAVTITQHNLELFGKKGETIELELELYDDAVTGVTVYPAVYNFTMDPDLEGSAIVITDPDELDPDIAWLTFDDESIDLPADGALVPFAYRIDIPQDATPGTHLLSLVFQTRPPDPLEEGTSVSVGSNVASNIFLKIGGATIDEIDAVFQVGSFAERDPQKPFSRWRESFERKTFFEWPPADFLVTVQNTGNTHQKPDGNIKIVNDLFGGVYDKINVNSENRIILPGTERTFEVDSFGRGFMIGKFRAKLTLVYGDPLRDMSEEVEFWIVPWKLLLLILVIILLIITLFILVHKHRKRKQRLEQVKMREEIEEEIKRDLKNDKSAAQKKPVSRTNGKKTNGKKKEG